METVFPKWKIFSNFQHNTIWKTILKKSFNICYIPNIKSKLLFIKTQTKHRQHNNASKPRLFRWFILLRQYKIYPQCLCHHKSAIWWVKMLGFNISLRKENISKFLNEESSQDPVIAKCSVENCIENKLRNSLKFNQDSVQINFPIYKCDWK